MKNVNIEEMMNGYLEMAEINLAEANVYFDAETEAQVDY